MIWRLESKMKAPEDVASGEDFLLTFGAFLL
jgi:hypothetical protein